MSGDPSSALSIPSTSPSDPSLPSTSPSDPSLPSTSTSDPSVPSTSTSDPSHSTLPSFPSYPPCLSAYWQTSLHEAGQRVGVPLSHPSDAPETRTVLGSGRQRQGGQDRGSVEFLHLNASIHSFIKVLSDQIIAGFNLINHSLQELTSKMDQVLSAVRQTPSQHYFHSVIGQLENLPSEQQIHVMRAFQNAIMLLNPLPPTTTAPPHPTASPYPPAAMQPPALYQPPPHYYHSSLPTQHTIPSQHTYPVQTSLHSLSPHVMPVPSPCPSSLSSTTTLHSLYHHSNSSPLLIQTQPSFAIPTYTPSVHHPSPSPQPSASPQPSPVAAAFFTPTTICFSTPSPSSTVQPSPSPSSLNTPHDEGVSPASNTSDISTPHRYFNL
ncbi:uncharacterized protein ACNLHF_008664 [Anomaloglossus baeobatrachus]